MADARFKVTTRQAGTPDVAGRALVLPGVRYTKDHPLLFWASEVLVAAGWHVAAVRWRATQADDPLEFVEAAADELDAAAPAADRTVVVAKSLGSYAAGWAARRGVPGIWLTPLLTVAAVRDQLAGSGVPGLLVGGTADRQWDGAAARGTGMDVVEVPDADHGMLLSGDWRASFDTLGRVLDAVEDFAGRLAAQ